ncbi:hypothetical protein FQA47_006538 [Oryzias melastigma]|uniref:Uncharacterized protein n=1 Tax=Oryzias melastigma TaxID=30732 RepID=A0A834C4C7_ORYME|nr:hypothetical protein FQA47_006538 [Oryzias melastigma]
MRTVDRTAAVCIRDRSYEGVHVRQGVSSISLLSLIFQYKGRCNFPRFPSLLLHRFLLSSLHFQDSEAAQRLLLTRPHLKSPCPWKPKLSLGPQSPRQHHKQRKRNRQHPAKPNQLLQPLKQRNPLLPRMEQQRLNQQQQQQQAMRRRPLAQTVWNT